VRDRDVMNLLDQLELYTLRLGGKQVSQRDYWSFVYESMKSGLLMTKSLEKHLRYKLEELGVNLQDTHGRSLEAIRRYQARARQAPAHHDSDP
jgi:hypothetical protein